MIKVKRKVFLFVSGAVVPEDGASLSIKLPYSGADVLELPLAEPMGYGMAKHGWVTLRRKQMRSPAQLGGSNGCLGEVSPVASFKAGVLSV